jgi:hypothetical protein
MQRLISISVIMLILPLVGCVTRPYSSSQGVLVTRFHEVKDGTRPPSIDSFSPHQTPTVYVFGYGGQTVTVKIYDLATGQAVTSETMYISRHKDKYWGFSDLSEGSYKAVLEVGGSPVAETAFDVTQ